MLEDENADIELIQNTLEGVEYEFEVKAENIAKLIKSLEYEAEILKSEKQRLEAKMKNKEAKIDWLKQYLRGQMQKAGKERIKTPLFNISIQNNPPAVEVIDEEKIPVYYIRYKAEIDKKAILAALKEGKEVPGAILKQEKGLRIR